MGSLPDQDLRTGQRRRIRWSLCRETECSIVDPKPDSGKVGFVLRAMQRCGITLGASTNSSSLSRLSQEDAPNDNLGVLAASDTIG